MRQAEGVRPVKIIHASALTMHEHKPYSLKTSCHNDSVVIGRLERVNSMEKGFLL
jgi:hypothetical protein